MRCGMLKANTLQLYNTSTWFMTVCISIISSLIIFARDRERAYRVSLKLSFALSIQHSSHFTCAPFIHFSQQQQQKPAIYLLIFIFLFNLFKRSYNTLHTYCPLLQQHHRKERRHTHTSTHEKEIEDLAYFATMHCLTYNLLWNRWEFFLIKSIGIPDD